MSKDEEELRRLINLRAKQIEDRDPQAKQRKIHSRISDRERRMRKRFGLRALGEEIRAVPKKWQGMFIGAMIGLAVLFGLGLTMQSRSAVLIGIAAIAILSVIGFLFGQAFEWRDEISDLGKG